MSIFPHLKSIVGRRLALGSLGNLVSAASGAEVDITPKCADASITIGAENTNVRAITIQLKDANGADIDYVENFEIHVFANAARTAYATGGSTGVAIGTDGALLAVVAKKIFKCTSEADGDWDGTWTDTGTESVALGILLPTGRMVMSEAFANT